MSPSENLYSILDATKHDFYVSVPCKLLSELIQIIEKDPNVFHTAVTREEEGLGILSGAFLGGRKPAIVMQNSGLGNSINAICSLVNYYEIPITFIMSHRGSEGEPVEAQRPMGSRAASFLEQLEINTMEIDDVNQLKGVQESLDNAFQKGQSSALLLPFSFWK